MSYSSITGNTPMIAIDEECRIWAKLETHNRTGSVKDRMIEYICDLAVGDGSIDPGKTTLIEATSGNTGIALASYAASMNCPCEIIMPSNMSQQRKDMMNAFGATIIETAPNAFKEAIRIRDELLISGKDYFSPLQFSNPLNTKCHYETTASEIYGHIVTEMRPLKWGAFVHGAGTGGTMMGIKKYIDDRGLDVKCILTTPAESAETHGIQGINDGADFLLDKTLMDEVVQVKTSDAIARMKKFWKDTGVLIGISSGANILAAEDYVEKHNPDGVVITILCDRGERYL